MSKKRNTKKTYNPPDSSTVPTIPSKFSSYILCNPAYPIEIIYQLLSNTSTEPVMVIRGKPEDFSDTPNIMFRKVNEPISIKKEDQNEQ